MRTWILSGAMMLAGSPSWQTPGSNPTAQAESLISRGHFAQAERILRNQIGSGAATPHTYYLMGFTLIRQFRPEEAETHLRRATQRQPRRHSWLHALAKSLMEQNKNRQAIRVLDRAIILKAEPAYHFSKAMCELNTGELEVAETELRRVLKMDPRHSESLHRLGRLLLDQGKDSDAIQLLQRCLKIAPGNLAARYALGLAESRSGEAEASIARFEAVIEQIPGHVGALYNLGRTLMRLRRPEEARKRLLQFKSMSVLEDKIQFLHRLVEKNPKHVDGRLQLVDELLKAGKSAEALQQLSAARALAPRHAPVYSRMAAVLRRMGRTEDAQRAEDFGRQLVGRRLEGPRP